MSERVEFVLADGVRVEVYWINGPPYLGVTYRKALLGWPVSQGPKEMRISDEQLQKNREETLCKNGHSFIYLPAVDPLAM